MSRRLTVPSLLAVAVLALVIGLFTALPGDRGPAALSADAGEPVPEPSARQQRALHESHTAVAQAAAERARSADVRSRQRQRQAFPKPAAVKAQQAQAERAGERWRRRWEEERLPRPGERQLAAAREMAAAGQGDAVVTGQVTDTASGAPIAGVTVSSYLCADDAECQRSETRTAADGTYTLTPVERSSETLVTFEDFESGHVRDVAYIDTTGGTATADAALRQGGWIEGTVVDARTGEPLADMCVDVYSAQGSGWSSGCTEADGRYRSSGIDAGTAFVYVNARDRRHLDRDEEAVEVRLGAGTVHNLPMQAGATVTGTVVDRATGAAVVDACITVRSVETGRRARADDCTDASGGWTIGPLAPGSYIATADGVDHLITRKAFTVPAEGDTTDVTIRAALGGRITGVVRDGHGVAAPDTCVRLKSFTRPRYRRSACTDEDGRYTINALRADYYRLHIRKTASSFATYYPSVREEELAAQVVVANRRTTTADIDGVAAGTIAGTVRFDGAAPQDDCAYVSVYLGRKRVAGTCVRESGSYEVGPLETGAYTVAFADWSANGYIGEWYDDQAEQVSADVVPVTAGRQTSGIDATLSRGGSIAGKVLVGEVAPESFCLTLWADRDQPVDGRCFSGGPAYLLDRLPSGTYKVQVDAYLEDGSTATEWFGGATNFDEADEVVVRAPEQVDGVDFELGAPGAISGTLIDEDSGQPASGACAYAYRPSDGWSWIRQACADEDGRYRLTGLQAGTYVVRFADGGFVAEWATDKATFESATLVEVEESQVTGLDGALARGASITGTVRNEAGEPLSTCLTAYPRDSYDGSIFACSDESGAYRLTGLAPGDYEIYVEGQEWYLSRWWPSSDGREGAVAVSVHGTETVRGIDAELVRGGTISGRVTDAVTGSALRDVCVAVYDLSGSYQSGACTGREGRYTTNGLRAGSYKVEFRTRDERTEWYRDAASFDGAEVVEVVTTSNTSGIDALVDPPLSGGLAGTVTADDTGEPLPGCVHVTGRVGNDQAWVTRSDCAAGDGDWSVGNLPDGDYVVEFAPVGRYLRQFWAGADTWDSATPVNVRGGIVAGIDGALERGLVITGRVTSESTGQPLANICADVSSRDGSSYGSGCTATDGTYTTTALRPGSYVVQFQNPGGRYAGEWYDDAATPADATDVVLTNEDAADIDAALVLGGRLSGTVTLDGRAPGQPCKVIVTVVDTSTNTPIPGQNCVGPDGRWTSSALTPGTYRVRFTTEVADEWFDDATTYETAKKLTVVAGETTGSIDADLRASRTRATVGDFDGDRRTDIGVFRAGQWLLDGHDPSYLGVAGFASVPADYDGDGTVEQAVWDPRTGAWHGVRPGEPTYFGVSGDVPVPGDYDGDGREDVAVYRPATGGWFIQGRGEATYFGVSGDVPVPGDYDGDGRDEVAVYRPATGGWFIQGRGEATYFGVSGDVPVAGDYDGDGRGEIAVYRPATGGWFVHGGGEPTYFGVSTDVPVAGDWDGDGATDLGVFRPETGAWLAPGRDAVFYGSSGDRPLPIPWAIWAGYYGAAS